MTRKNKPSQRSHGTFTSVVMLLLVVFMAGFVSSAEFDNVGDYDPVTRTITITNAFGLGAEIGTARLNTPLNVKVGAGYQQVAEIYQCAYSDYNDAIKQFSYTDIKKKEKINRDIDIKYLSYENVEVEDWGSIEAGTTENGTVIYESILTGTHIEVKKVWNKVTPANFKKNECLTIGLFTDVQIGDFVDWVPTIYGVEVPEWATWTQSDNVGITGFYRLDEPSGNAVDATGTHSAGTSTGIVYGASGRVNKSYTFTASSSDRVDLGFVPSGTAFTWNVWFYFTSTAGASTYRLLANDAGTGVDMSFGGGVPRIFLDNDFFDATTDFDGLENDWYMMSLTYDDNDNIARVSINGVSENTMDLGHSISWGSYNLRIGNRPEDDRGFPGRIDGVSLWDRRLSQPELLNIFNAGVDGNEYKTSYSTDNPPTIILNSPSTANYTTIQTPTINFTASDDLNLSSVKLYVNDVLNQTNASGINNTNYLFDLTLNDGDYTIYGTATDNESQETNSSSIIIGIDTIAPVLTITDNTDAYPYALPINKTLNMSVVDIHTDTCIYWTSDNATNITITCGTPVNTSWATGGNKTIYAWVNDTYGLTDTAQDSFYINYIQESLGYEATVLAGDIQTLYLNITATDITTYDVNFTYNGSGYVPTVSNNGTLLQAYVILTNPTIPDDYVINWTYQINALTNSTNVTQTVKTLTALVVSSNGCTDKAVTFKLQDEVNATNLTGSISYNIKYGPSLITNEAMEVYGTVLGGNITLCINATESPNYYIGYGELQYSATGYVDRRFYMFEDSTISNATYETKFLRELETTEQTSFLLTLQDSDLNVYSNKYTAMWRWYPDLNAYKIVEMGKTDDDGQTVAHVRTEDVDYRTALYHLNGSLIKFDSPRRFLCTASPCSLDIVVGDESDDLTAFFDIEQSLTYNKTSGIISYVFNDPNQLTQSMRLLVEKIVPTNEITICDTTTTGYTGVINCNISIYSGTFKATVYRTASPEVPIAQKLISTADTLFKSSFGLFFSAILWLAIVLTGLAGGPILTVVLAIVALLPALFLGSINLAIFTGFAVLGAIILHFIKRSMD